MDCSMWRRRNNQICIDNFLPFFRFQRSGTIFELIGFYYKLLNGMNTIKYIIWEFLIAFLILSSALPWSSNDVARCRRDSIRRRWLWLVLQGGSCGHDIDRTRLRTFRLPLYARRAPGWRFLWSKGVLLNVYHGPRGRPERVRVREVIWNICKSRTKRPN